MQFRAFTPSWQQSVDHLSNNVLFVDGHTVRIPKDLISFIRMITTPLLTSVSKCLLGLNLIQMSFGWFVRGRDRSPEQREEVGRHLCCGCQGSGRGLEQVEGKTK